MISQSPRSKRFWARLLLTGATTLLGTNTRTQQIPAEYRSQIDHQAALVASQPAKISAKLLTPEIRVGGKARVQIDLINVENQSVAPKEDWKCDISIHLPSGGSVEQAAWIKKDSSSGEFEFAATEPGIVTVLVRAPSNKVRGDKLEVIVQSPKKSSNKKKNSSMLSRPLPTPVATIDPYLVPRNSVALRLVGFSPESQGSASAPENIGKPSPAATERPMLHISTGDVGGTYFANGKDAATISATYESSDLTPAPSDIHVWFHWVNGTLDAQPLLIKKGTFSGITHLTSLRAGDVNLKFVSSTPPYRAEGDTDLTAHFVPPLVALLGPERLSIVDNTPVMIVFLDAQNNPVAPGKNWSVTLRSKESRLHFGPESFEVPGNSPIGTAQLLPVSWGNDTVEAVVANYNPQPLTVVVTGWIVVGLCLGGGIAGGLAAYSRFKGSWFWRLFLGILGGAVLSWMYVFLALPNVGANVAHSIVSVLFVSILGGYLGTTVLDLAAKRFGWITA
jgi:hypothetical protein